MTDTTTQPNGQTGTAKRGPRTPSSKPTTYVAAMAGGQFVTLEHGIVHIADPTEAAWIAKQIASGGDKFRPTRIVD